jgi:2-dehydro-3-deoxy-D-arabinonate dehydratase
MARLVRVRGDGGGTRCGWVTERGVEWMEDDPLAALVAGGPPGGADAPQLPDGAIRPLDPPEVWAAGVTYERSRQARVEESHVEDVYSLVYDADRPELFLKDANGQRTVGPGETIGIRSDARWTVPEPELALVLGEGGRVLGATAANDVTARDIEAENPLYLPQAKIFAAACSLGPCILTPDEWPDAFTISCRIERMEGLVWQGETSTARMKRSFEELVSWLVRENPVPAGTVLLTGTGLVPPDEVALAPGHRVEIAVTGIGTLVNAVGAAAELMVEERSRTHV